MENITFHLSDMDGNMLLDQVFYIKIEMDYTSPIIITNKVLTVRQMGIAPISKEYLFATDKEADQMKLKYKVSIIYLSTLLLLI